MLVRHFMSFVRTVITECLNFLRQNLGTGALGGVAPKPNPAGSYEASEVQGLRGSPLIAKLLDKCLQPRDITHNISRYQLRTRVQVRIGPGLCTCQVRESNIGIEMNDPISLD